MIEAAERFGSSLLSRGDEKSQRVYQAEIDHLRPFDEATRLQIESFLAMFQW